MNKQKIGLILMPICTAIAVLIAIVGLFFIAVRALSSEAWDQIKGAK